MAQHEGSLRASIGRLLAPAVWITGAVLTALAWFASTPLLGVATLGVSLVVTLLLARLAIGWRAVPAVFTLLGLLSPVLLLLGSAYLHRWVGSYGALGLDSESRTEWRSFLWTMMASAFLASPSAFLLGMRDAAFTRLRAAAVHATPVIFIAALGISTYSAIQLVRRPSAETYAASLPVVAVIPASADQPCTPFTEEVQGHHARWSQSWCKTEDVSVPPFSFHYHCVRDEGASCALFFRVNGTEQEDSIFWYEPSQRAVDVHWDDSLDSFLIQEHNGRLVLLDRRRASQSWPSPVDLGARVGPSASWFAVAASGLGVALLAWAILRFVRRFVDVSSSAHREWLERFRGDLALVTMATVLITSALLVSTLFASVLP